MPSYNEKGVTDTSLDPHRQTLKDGVTQLLRSRSEALVRHFFPLHVRIISGGFSQNDYDITWGLRPNDCNITWGGSLGPTDVIT